MAGHVIALYLKERGHEVIGFARNKSDHVDTVIGDAYDTNFIVKNLAEGKYDVVINCIGMLNQFAENNKAAAVFLNSYLPHCLVKATEGSSTRVIDRKSVV